jgi:alkylhydroperoxidase family enzyme
LRNAATSRPRKKRHCVSPRSKLSAHRNSLTLCGKDLRKYFDEGEIVELTAAIGLFNYFNRANDVLRMDPTKPGEGAPPGQTTGS